MAGTGDGVRQCSGHRVLTDHGRVCPRDSWVGARQLAARLVPESVGLWCFYRGWGARGRRAQQAPVARLSLDSVVSRVGRSGCVGSSPAAALAGLMDGCGWTSTRRRWPSTSSMSRTTHRFQPLACNSLVSGRLRGAVCLFNRADDGVTGRLMVEAAALSRTPGSGLAAAAGPQTVWICSGPANEKFDLARV